MMLWLGWMILYVSIYNISICNKPLQQPLQLLVPVVVAVVVPRAPIFPFLTNIMADFLFMTGYRAHCHE